MGCDTAREHASVDATGNWTAGEGARSVCILGSGGEFAGSLVGLGGSGEGLGGEEGAVVRGGATTANGMNPLGGERVGACGDEEVLGAETLTRGSAAGEAGDVAHGAGYY